MGQKNFFCELNLGDYIKINTYKRNWYLCKKTGAAWSQEKDNYKLGFLGIQDLKKQKMVTEESIYDYFINDTHIEWADKEGNEFIEKYLNPSGLSVAGKDILDISGGNGHIMKKIEGLGARISATEFNKKTVEYISKTHGFDVWEYDINKHNLFDKTGREFDIVFARACIMFAKDLQDFVWQISNILKPGGKVMINHSVVPTLGVLLRTQLDEHSYYCLRQPEEIIDVFNSSGLSLTYRHDETDESLYVYDHDLIRHWRILYMYYENKALKALKGNRLFKWPSRDRRRSTMVFEKQF